jgi:hypothetical protein
VFEEQKHIGLPITSLEFGCKPQVASAFDQVFIYRNRRCTFQMLEVEQSNGFLIGRLLRIVFQQVCHQFGIYQEPANEMIVRMSKVKTGHSEGCRIETATSMLTKTPIKTRGDFMLLRNEHFLQ